MPLHISRLLNGKGTQGTQRTQGTKEDTGDTRGHREHGHKKAQGDTGVRGTEWT